MKNKINEKKDYLISEISKCKAIFTKRRKFNFSRFLEMNDADWDIVIKRLFWDRWNADLIKDQAIANTLVDWVWGSGVHGIKIPQRMLGVTADGVVGAKTIEALNNAPKDFLQRLYKEREDFLHRIVKNNPTQKVFLKGWMNRMNDLKKWNEKFAK